MTIHDETTGKTRFAVVPAAYVYLLREASGGVTEVLLQLRQNTGYMDHHWAAAAAGHVEQGETAYDAAHREALEELAVSGIELEFATSMQRTAHGPAIDERIDFFFTARSWVGEPTIVESDKCAELRWCALDALPDPVVPHEAAVLVALREGTLAPYSTFGFRPDLP